MKSVLKYGRFSLICFLFSLLLCACDKENNEEKSNVTKPELLSQPSFVYTDKDNSKIILHFGENMISIKEISSQGEIEENYDLEYTLDGDNIRINYYIYGYMEMVCSGTIWKVSSDKGKQLYMDLERNNVIGGRLSKVYDFSSVPF